MYRRGREAYKRYTSEQIKIVESSSIYGLAHRNCNHLYNYVDRHTISFQLSFFFFLNTNKSTFCSRSVIRLIWNYRFWQFLEFIRKRMYVLNESSKIENLNYSLLNYRTIIFGVRTRTNIHTYQGWRIEGLNLIGNFLSKNLHCNVLHLLSILGLVAFRCSHSFAVYRDSGPWSSSFFVWRHKHQLARLSNDRDFDR